MLILGDQHPLQNESLEIEFKEFCFNENININLSQKFINEIVYKGKISENNEKIFNENVYKNIDYYFYKYIPKYISSYLNAKINGKLFIGIDDFGEITGIPFLGTKKELKEYINKIDYSHLISENFNEICKLKINKLDINKHLLNDSTDNIIKNYHNLIKEKQQILEQYKKDRIIWTNKINEYTCKLPILLESKKVEFNNYLKQHAPHLLNYTIHKHEMRYISHLKVDPNHYIYWLMKYKDIHLSIIKKEKPLVPLMPKIVYNPNYLFNKLTHLRYKMLNMNSKLNYFLITIEINYSVLMNKNKMISDVFYFNINKQCWLKKIRQLDNDKNPKCDD